MILALLILYVVTLIYLPITERFRNHTSLIALQGWILLGIALLRLHSLEGLELAFIIVETLVFKALVVPAILLRVIRKTKINRVSGSGSSQFNSLLLSLCALGVSCWIASAMADERIDIFFGVALYALLSGLVMIVVRRRVFAHLVGFLAIENGVFLFSMAIGVEMPMMINMAIMLDILISILLLGIFLRKLDNSIHTDDADALTTVKD